MKSKILMISAFALAVIAVSMAIYYYRRGNRVAALGSEISSPGVKKVMDGIITVNAYTKQEKFHPDMKQADADAIVLKLVDIEKKKDHKQRKSLLNQLVNSFYRYDAKAGKAVKMSDNEVRQIIIFESTFTGIYD